MITNHEQNMFLDTYKKTRFEKTTSFFGFFLMNGDFSDLISCDQF